VTWLDRLKALRVDTMPLRTSRDFRLLLTAATVFDLGGMVSYVAVPYQLYALTRSNAAVGAIGAAELLPLLVFGLYGGALADHVDRRRLLVLCGLAQALVTAVLAANAFRARPSIWVIYAAAVLLACASSLQRPSREALFPRTVTHAELPAATALDTLGREAGRLVGPGVGGVLVAYAGTGWCFVTDMSGMLVASVLYALMRRYPHRAETTPPILRAIADSLRYAVSRRDLLGSYLVDVVAMVLAMPVVLFPALVGRIFHAPQLLGLVYSAETVGALAMSALSGWTRRVHRHGRAIVGAAAAYGLCIALAGVMPSVWLTAVALAAAGAADEISVLFRGTLWSQTIPESMRGRLAGIELLSYSLGPMGGQVRAGVTADLWNVRASIASGGIACAVGVAATAAWLRGFWSYDARTDEHAISERAARAAAGV
jgi:MFS family permease